MIAFPRFLYRHLSALLIFWLCCGLSSSQAATFYVSTSGNDSNPGTVSSPFKTIQKGVSKLKAGDILYVRGGTYVESVYVGQSGTETQPVTISAYPGELPVIDGADKLPASDGGDLVLVVGDYVIFDGFEVRNSNINGTRLGGGGVMLEGEHTCARNLNVHHTWEHGIIAKGNYSKVEYCEVWQCAFSNSKNPGSPAAGYWSTGISAARSPVDGITRNAVLRGNISYNNWGEGISSFEADGTLIEDNISFDNWSVNLYISDTRNALVQRNIVYNTPNNVVGQRRPLTLGDELAHKPRSANNKVLNNFMYNADLWAFWSTGVPGSGLDNVLIAFNTIVNGQLEIGASPEDGVVNKSAVICNNVFFNENQSPWEIMGPVNNVSFYNNLWSAQPPPSLRGNDDLVDDPFISRLGSVKPGELSAEYFMLLPNSPAIDQGKPVDGIENDFFGHERGASPDIGAHEYQLPSGLIGLPVQDPREKLPRVTILSHELNIYLPPDHRYRDYSIINSAGTRVLHGVTDGDRIVVDISSWHPGLYVVVLVSQKDADPIKIPVVLSGRP